MQAPLHYQAETRQTWWRKSSKERVDLEPDEWNAQETFFDLVNCLNQRIFVGLPLGPSFFPHVLIVDSLI